MTPNFITVRTAYNYGFKIAADYLVTIKRNKQ